MTPQVRVGLLERPLDTGRLEEIPLRGRVFKVHRWPSFVTVMSVTPPILVSSVWTGAR